MNKHKNRMDLKFTKGIHPSRAKLGLYPRFKKPKTKKRKVKRKKDHES